MSKSREKASATMLCYLCRRRPGLTKDHVPPKNLFPKPRPSGLITVACCHDCNNRFSKHDEYFRLVVSCCINRAPEGERIWREKVIPSTLEKRRIGRLIDEAGRNVQSGHLVTPDGEHIPANALVARTRPIKAVLLKIVKGFLYFRDPSINSRKLKFKITQMDQFRFRKLLPTLNNLKRLELGDGVFDCWWGIDAGSPPNGLWYFRFYRSAAFLVQHEPRR